LLDLVVVGDEEKVVGKDFASLLLEVVLSQVKGCRLALNPLGFFLLGPFSEVRIGGGLRLDQ